METSGCLAQSRKKYRWLLKALTFTVATSVIVLFLLVMLDMTETPSISESTATTANARFTQKQQINKPELLTLRWDEISRAAASIGSDPSLIERVTVLASQVGTPPALYLRALLLIAKQQPEEALATFKFLDLDSIPVVFLYAPHRLQQTLRPHEDNPYLTALRQAVVKKNVPALIRARVQAQDGDLSTALTSYLQTDPASWVSYDLESMRKIANHQGLAADLGKLIAGALSSGRVNSKLTPALLNIASEPSNPPDMEIFKQQIQRAVKEKSPEGILAIESSKKMLLDRKMFLARNYKGLIANHLEDEPMQLSTETALLLFLAAVDLKQQLEVERWGQELIRRHDEAEVRDWVNKQTASLQ